MTEFSSVCPVQELQIGFAHLQQVRSLSLSLHLKINTSHIGADIKTGWGPSRDPDFHLTLKRHFIDRSAFS